VEVPLAGKTMKPKADPVRISLAVSLDESEWEEFRRLSNDCGQAITGRIRFLILRDLKAARSGVAPEPFPVS
jgi:hypothetical protein